MIYEMRYKKYVSVSDFSTILLDVIQAAVNSDISVQDNAARKVMNLLQVVNDNENKRKRKSDEDVDLSSRQVSKLVDVVRTASK